MIDTFRSAYPTIRQYSYFTSMIPKARECNFGYRLDYALLSQPLSTSLPINSGSAASSTKDALNVPSGYVSFHSGSSRFTSPVQPIKMHTPLAGGDQPMKLRCVSPLHTSIGFEPYIESQVRHLVYIIYYIAVMQLCVVLILSC